MLVCLLALPVSCLLKHLQELCITGKSTNFFIANSWKSLFCFEIKDKFQYLMLSNNQELLGLSFLQFMLLSRPHLFATICCRGLYTSMNTEFKNLSALNEEVHASTAVFPAYPRTR